MPPKGTLKPNPSAPGSTSSDTGSSGTSDQNQSGASSGPQNNPPRQQAGHRRRENTSYTAAHVNAFENLYGQRPQRDFLPMDESSPEFQAMSILEPNLGDSILLEGGASSENGGPNVATNDSLWGDYSDHTDELLNSIEDTVQLGRTDEEIKQRRNELLLSELIGPAAARLQGNTAADLEGTGSEDDAEEESSGDKKPTKGETISKLLDHLSFVTNIFTDGVDITKDISKVDTGLFKGGDAERFKTADEISGIAVMANSGVSALNGIYKSFQNHKKLSKLKSSNRYANNSKRDIARNQFWGGAAGVLGNLALGTTRGLTMYADPNEKLTKDFTMGGLTATIGAVASLSSMVSTFASMNADRIKRNEHKRIADAIGDDEDSSIFSVKQKKKFGLDMAHNFNEKKYHKVNKGAFGFASALVGGYNAITGFMPGFQKSKTGTILKLVADASAKVLKYTGKIAEERSDENSRREVAEDKEAYVRRYISEKSAKLDDKIFSSGSRELKLSVSSAHLTPNEKDRIVLAMLGYNTEITDREVTKEEMVEAFDRLAVKKARKIMNAEPTEKGSVLGALGLTANAKEEDIIAALTGQ